MKDVHCRRQSPFVCKCTENIVELIQFVSILQSLNFSITSSVLNIRIFSLENIDRSYISLISQAIPTKLWRKRKGTLKDFSVIFGPAWIESFKEVPLHSAEQANTFYPLSWLENAANTVFSTWMSMLKALGSILQLYNR